MSLLARVAVHPSQFPDRVRQDLLASLRTRQVNHKFHYDSIKQTQKWLALHQAYSPSRTDTDCARAYEESFAAVSAQLGAAAVGLVGLGCGGGQKDARLLQRLRQAGKQVFYAPVDVSTAMVLVAWQAALQILPAADCFPLVCDLAAAEDPVATLSQVLPARPPAPARLFTFFGMIPNFEPEVILPRLVQLVGPADWLLFSANLAPGSDYATGVKRVLPLYDNELTREWLMTFLLDLGVETDDGQLQFRIEAEPRQSGLRRIAAYFHFRRRREVSLDAERFVFAPGESVRLFFSYRHTPLLVRALLEAHGLQVTEQWITKSEEEGVFLVKRACGA